MPLEPAEMLAAEAAVDLGADLLRRGRAHLGSLIPKGERDYATAVAAGALLVREAGGEAYDYDGTPYSSRSLFTLASVPGIAGELPAIVGESIGAVASTWPARSGEGSTSAT